MSLTKLEAQERAPKIWQNVREIQPRHNGTWMVELRDGTVHFLDGNGHTTCHAECARKEEMLP